MNPSVSLRAAMASTGVLGPPNHKRAGDGRPRRWGRAMSIASVAALGTLACSAPGHVSRKAAPAWTDPSPHGEQMIAVAPGVRLEVLDWGGSGMPVVFLSGLDDVAHGFDDFAPRFTNRYHVIAITRRGYGASSQPASGYDLATRVADLRAVLDSLGLARVVLVGHSIAGDELTGFAGRYPDRVAGLIYLDAAYDHSGIASLLRNNPPPPLPPMTGADSASPAAVAEWTLRTWGMRIPEAQIRAVGRYDSAGRLVGDVTPSVIDSLVLAGCGRPDYSAVHAPALAIYAVIDSVGNVFPAWRQLDSAGQARASNFVALFQRWGTAERARFRAGVRGARILELHGANHYVFDSNEPEVEAAMRAFLGSLSVHLGTSAGTGR